MSHFELDLFSISTQTHGLCTSLRDSSNWIKWKLEITILIRFQDIYVFPEEFSHEKNQIEMFPI